MGVWKTMAFAHSIPDKPTDAWEPLSVHLREVGELAERFATQFGFGEAGRIAGLLHDIGKASSEFQAYIAAGRAEAVRGPDHSTAGAIEAEKLFGPHLGRMLAFAIAGHHAGLADHSDLRRRQQKTDLPSYSDWRTHVGQLPEAAALRGPASFTPNAHSGFSQAFLTRMLFSCLVDADFLATERFYARVDGREPERGAIERLDEQRARLARLQAALTQHMATKVAAAPDNELNRLRAEVLAHAVGKATEAPGLFTLTVPTGGGKTLTSLAFALEHARRHRLRRVIYVIPYTSIIEQTADVFRSAFGPEHGGDILEHHSTFDWDAPRDIADADSEGPSGLIKLRRAAENWAAPIVVTTAVQFFESLFARRTSQCRKLHNIAGSVVVLDEAQTLPLHLLRPCMAALNELATNYQTSVVLCTATQPALRVCDEFTDENRAPRAVPQKVGFAIDDTRELAPEPARLYAGLKRVEVHRLPGETDDVTILARFAEQPQMLCIVNTRAHARELYDALRAQTDEQEGVYHLSTLMCPVHRRAVLATVRERLDPNNPKPVRLIATSLIEAGVDVDFPEVWRAVAGLDQVAQAAGRCNREGRLGASGGRTIVFYPAGRQPAPNVATNVECAEAVFRQGLDPLSLEGVKAYFAQLYWRRGAEAMDAPRLDNQPWPILQAIRERCDGTFEFEAIDRAFRMIDDLQETVIVPYDAAAERLLAKIAAADRPTATDLRKLQQYAVAIPRREHSQWLAAGVLRAVSPSLGEAMLCFSDLAHYRDDTGVDLHQPERRDAGSNVI